MLKRWGCRWSKGRRAWYFIGETLPDAVQKIITAWGDVEAPYQENSQVEDVPCSHEEAEAILGVKLAPSVTEQDPVEHRFTIGQTVYYAGTKPLITEKGSAVTFGFAGTILELHHRTSQAYVDFRWSGCVFGDEALLSDTKPIAPHAFQLGQTVYAAHLLRITDSLKLPADTEGQVVRRYKYRQQGFNPHYTYAGEYAYDVQFAGQSQAYSVFEENLSDAAEGMAIQRDERFMVVPGISAQTVIEMAIQRRQNIPNEYEVLDELDTHLPGKVSEDEVVNDIGIQPPLLPEVETETVRVIKPETLPENLQNAIQVAKQQPSLNISGKPVSSAKLSPIAQKYVGELTGSITGQVFCYGYASHNEILLFLNMGGPRMAIEAIRAKLSKGEIVNLIPWDAPAIELSAGETDGKANTGMFTAYLNNIPEAKFTSAILVHEWLIQPNYKGKSLTAIFRTSAEQAVAKLLYHVRQLVNIPVFDAWASYLYHAGQNAGLIRKPRSAGDIDLLLLDLDAEAWTRLITGGLANKVISLFVNAGQ